MALIVLSGIAYALVLAGLWLSVDDPWTRVGTIASVVGTTIAVVTLVLVSFLKRDLVAKSRLGPLVKRLGQLNSELAAGLKEFRSDPKPVRHSLAAIYGVLVSIDGKVPADYKVLVRNARKQVSSQSVPIWVQRIWIRPKRELTEDQAWEMYETLISAHAAIKELVRDLEKT